MTGEMQKVCRGCGELLALDLYPVDSRRPDGHRAQCRSCTAKSAKEYRKKMDPEHIKELHRRSIERHPEKVLERRRRFRKNHPDRNRAHWMINKAVRIGRIIKPKTCEWCGVGGRIEASHDDYSKPYDVLWLCPSCHRKRDAGGKHD